MKIVGLEELQQREPEAAEQSGSPPSAVTIGVFDGVHIGHQRLIREVVENELAAMPVLCTFRQNPGSVLGTRRLPGSVLSFRQKMAKLEALGIAEVVLIDFSPEISKLTGKSFIDLLDRYLDIRELVVGYNFHMGKDRETGVEELKWILDGSGTELVIVPATYHNGRAVSSSRIRDCIREGNFWEIRTMIGQPFCLDLRDVQIEVRGFRAETRREAFGQILPKPGEYPAYFRTDTEKHAGNVIVREQSVAWTRPWQEQEIEICFA